MLPMRDTYTVAQAAAELGITPSTLRHLCIRRGLGTKISANLRLLTRAEVDSLRDRKIGRPRSTKE